MPTPRPSPWPSPPLRRVPTSTAWYADPSGATEIAELRAAGLKVLRGDNDVRLGIAAVTARIRTGRLRVNRTSCPNLIAESKLYRYPAAHERAALGEAPIDADNHALAALRYLVSRIDHRFIARLRTQQGERRGVSPTCPRRARRPDPDRPAPRGRPLDGDAARRVRPRRVGGR